MVNNEACDNVISHCNYIIVNDKTSKGNVSELARKLIEKQNKRNPALFQLWEGGPYWHSNIDFKSFIDAIMHLLFLGVTKSSKNLLDMSLKKLGSKSTLSTKCQKQYDYMII